MSANELSEATRQFLMAYVQDFEELEVLLLARRERAQSLDPATAASALGLDADVTRAVFARLASRGLLRQNPLDASSYEYAPSAELSVSVEALAEAYAQQRIAVVSTIGSNAILRIRTSAIKTFAEAFLLKKGNKKDG